MTPGLARPTKAKRKRNPRLRWGPFKSNCSFCRLRRHSPSPTEAVQGQWCAGHCHFFRTGTHRPLIQPLSLRNHREVEVRGGPGHLNSCTTAGDTLPAWGNLLWLPSLFVFPFLSLAIWSDTQVVPFKRVCRLPPASDAPSAAPSPAAETMAGLRRAAPKG